MRNRPGNLVLVLVFALIASAASLAAAGCGPMTPPAAAPASSPTPPAGRHHAQNFSDPSVHGPYAKVRTEDCTQCHGANLDGQGSQVDPASLSLAPQGCNTHHNLYSAKPADAWRTDCTFCHGDRSGSYDAAKTGAPPRDLKDVGCTPSQTGCDPVVPDAAMVSQLAFKSHRIHLSASATHVAYDCQTCHVSKPSDAMSPGHWIVGDDTPGVVELRPVLGGTNGAPAGGSYAGTGSGTCQNTWCHGNGQGANGTISDSQTSTGCSFCHAGPSSGSAIYSMSGRHGDHVLDQGVKCYECHGATVDSSNAIVDVTKHLDGTKELSFATSNMTYSNGQCTGTCHGETHSGRTW